MKRSNLIAWIVLCGVCGLNIADSGAQDATGQPTDPPSNSRQEMQRPNRAGAPKRRIADRENAGLKVGEIAPNFKLKSLDGESETELATLSNTKPVVLFFGSYNRGRDGCCQPPPAQIRT